MRGWVASRDAIGYAEFICLLARYFILNLLARAYLEYATTNNIDAWMSITVSRCYTGEAPPCSEALAGGNSTSAISISSCPFI
jgi:hypothetical protein